MASQDLRSLADRISNLVDGANTVDGLRQLRYATRELEQQCMPSAEIEYDFHYQPHRNACVRIAIELGIFDLLGEEPTMPVDLASKVELARPEFTLRIIRVLCASGVLGERELPVGKVVVYHTALSRLWRLQPTKQAYAKHQWDNTVQTLSCIIPFLRERGFCSPQDAFNSPFAYLLGEKDADFFSLLQQHPERLASFNQGMTGTATSVTSIFPFDSLLDVSDTPVSLVDVGGGNGHTTQDIITACPGLKGKVVLQDLSGMLEHTDKLRVERKVVQIQSYNFLREVQPVRGAAAYLYKSIFHDWPDDSCRQILRNLAPSVRGSDSRLLICDLVIDRMASKHPHKVMRDMNMMIMAGRERTADEWDVLLRTEGFEIVKIWGVENSGNSIVEARLVS